MFTVCVNGKSQVLQCDYEQMVKFFPNALKLTKIPEEGQILPKESPDTLVQHFYNFDMDPKKRKCDVLPVIPVPEFLVNNPNISLIPAKKYANVNQSPSSSKQLPVSSVNRVTRVVPVSCEPVVDQRIIKTDPKVVQNSCKRIASNPISNRRAKLPRLSITKLPKVRKDKSADKVKNNESKKIDSPSKFPNINTAVTCGPSTSTVRVSQEPKSQQPTNGVTITDLNCKLDEDVAASVDVEKHQGGIKRTYEFMIDGFKCDIINDEKDSPTNIPCEFRLGSDLFKIQRPEFMNDIILAIGSVMKKNLSNDEMETVKQNAHVLQSLEHNRASETNDVPLTNSMLSPTNHNKYSSTSKSQCASQVGVKSQRTTGSASKVPKLASCHVPVSTKQLTLSKSVSKIQQVIKHNEPKHMSSNQHAPSLLDKIQYISTTQIQSVNKQISGEQHSTSKHSIASVVPPATYSKHPISPVVTQSTLSKHSVAQLPSVTKQLISLPQSGKPTVVCQSSLQEHSAVSVAQLPSVTKQLISVPQSGKPTVCQSLQEHSAVSVTQLPLVTKQLINIPQSGKPTVVCQSSLQEHSAVSVTQIPSVTKQLISVPQSGKPIFVCQSSLQSSSQEHSAVSVTQIPSVTKQLISVPQDGKPVCQSSLQEHSTVSVAQLPSVTKQLISVPQGGKPTVVCQSSLQEHSAVSVTQLPSVTKHLINVPQSGKPTVVCQSSLQSSSQEHSAAVSVTQIPSGTKQLISLPQGGKPTILCQSFTQEVKKCSKCNVSSNDDVCTSCRMNSQLKGVTITLVDKPLVDETPGNNLIDNVQIISDDEEEIIDKDNIEPTVRKTETPEELTKHIDKLHLNPKLLEDKLWQKDLGIKDYYKFERCHSVRIGNFNTSPVPSGDMVICKHGIRMTINNSDSQPVTIDIHMDNIVKVLGSFNGETPSLFVYTNYLAAYGIRYLLNMRDDNQNYYFNPTSKDHTQSKIIWFFDLKKNEVQPLERLLLLKLLPKGKYESLTMEQVKTILLKSNKKPVDKNRVNYEQLQLTNPTICDRPAPCVRITDYRVLTIDQYLNDVIIEFYLNYAYCRKLSVEDQERTYVYDTFLYASLTRPGTSTSTTRYDKIDKGYRFKKVNIFEKDFIVVPINENFHWFMAMICFPYLTCPVYMDDGTPVPKEEWVHSDESSSLKCETLKKNFENLSHGEDINNFKDVSNIVGVNYETYLQNLNKTTNGRPIKQPCILIFDSLCGGIQRTRIVARLRRWLTEEYRKKYNGAEKDFSPNVMKGAIIKVPQQENMTDCGLFLIHYFEKFYERPILDYRFPIRHLGNWFHPNEVTLNCQKRRDVQRVILDLMKEQGVVLPTGYSLPTLKFSSNQLPKNHQLAHKPTTSQPRVQSREFYNEDTEHIENYTIDHSDRHNYVGDHDPDHHNFMEDDHPDHHNFMEDHDPDNHNFMEEVNEGDYIDQYNQYPDEYMRDEYAEISDQREYYGEMGENVDWPMDTQDEFSELDYDADRDVNQYQNFISNNENVVVEVDTTRTGTGIRRNHQNVPMESVRLFRSNHSTYRNHVQEICDDEDEDCEEESGDENSDIDDDDIEEEEEEADEEDDDDGGSAHSKIHSTIHNGRHYRRLSN